MELDERLEGILEKHSIGTMDVKSEITLLLNKMIHGIDSNKTVSIRGAGFHTETLWSILDDESRSRIECISADGGGKAPVKGIRFVPAEDESAHTDVVIISSFLYRKEIRQNSIDRKENAEMIDIYEYLSENGIEMGTDFHNYFGRSAGCYDLLALYKRKYGCERKISQRQEYLRRIIGLYIYIRDFESFFKYVDIYADERFEGWENYRSCAVEIRQLLGEISQKIQGSEYHHIIVSWIDALRYDELPMMPKLAKETEKGAFFENAYTVMPYTTMTLEMIMRNEYVVNAKLYKKPQITEENSPVLKTLASEGYDFYYIGSRKMNLFFEEQNRCGEEMPPYSTCTPYVLWAALKKLYSAERNLCLLMHCLPETHLPFLSGYTTGVNGNFAVGTPMEEIKGNSQWCRQWEEGRLYVDDKLDDFLGCIGRGKNTMVYLSDHGKFSHGGKVVSADMLHTCFAVVSPYIKKCRVKGVFSNINFAKVIEWIVGAAKGNAEIPEGMLSDYSLIQNLDMYDNGDAIARLQTVHGNPQSLKENLQCRGLITPNELFIKYPDGDMRYYLLPDENTNHINDEEYQERVNELKNIEMAPFIDPYEDDDFAASRVLYDYIAEKLPSGN